MKLLLICLLAGVSALAADPWEQQVVAAVLMGEARGDGALGMTAVGEVIHQRAVESGQRPVDVVARGFSSRAGKTNVEMVRAHSRERGWKTALEIAATVCDHPEKLPGITRGANYFDRKDARPSWSLKARRVAVIRHHAFYRLYE